MWNWATECNGIKTQARNRIRTPQMDGYEFDNSIDPTHTMLAKDGNDHPLHELAAMLANEAVLNVGNHMQAAWNNKNAFVDLLKTATSYLYILPSQAR